MQFILISTENTDEWMSPLAVVQWREEMAQNPAYICNVDGLCCTAV